MALASGKVKQTLVVGSGRAAALGRKNAHGEALGLTG